MADIRRRSILLGSTLALAPALLTRRAKAADGPIGVGTIFPLSGPTGPNGIATTNGVKLFVDLANASGGLLGRQLELFSTDEQSTPAVGVSRANELIGRGVSVIIEGWNSAVSLATQPVIARAGIFDIISVAKADALMGNANNPYAVRIDSSNAQDAGVIARYLVRSLKAKRLIFMTQNDAYGTGAQAGMEAEIKRLDPSVQVVATEKFPFTQTDFRVALTNVAGITADAVVVINGSQSAGMPALLRQYHDLGIKMPVVGSVGGLTDAALKLAGHAADGAVAADVYFPYLLPLKDVPANKVFIAAHKKAFGEDPDKFAAFGYASMQVWAHAVQETKSLDRKTLAEAIQGKASPGTIFGDVTFSREGQMSAAFTLFRVVDGTTRNLEVLPDLA